MEWIPLDSSVFLACAYVDEEQALYLYYRSGEVYRYLFFMPGQFREFLAADSQGRYFASHIREKFPFEKVTGIVSRSAKAGST